jgi:hypothetical protein
MSRAVGVAPGFLLLPAREYEWELKDRIQIKVPMKGKISDLLGGRELGAGVKIAGEDRFSVMEDGVLLLWEVLRILFAQAQYPALESNGCLNVVAMEFEGNDAVILHGEIIKSVE